jgi:hypothetical protein
MTLTQIMDELGCNIHMAQSVKKLLARSSFAARNGSGIPAGHPEATCDDCNGPNVVWFAPSHLWNKVARRAEDPMLCPRCFILRAQAMGIRETWVVSIAEPRVYK